MARRGSAPGERRGGRQPGVPNRRTIERLAAAEARVEQARASGQKLGIEVLREFMMAFAGQATIHQPLPRNVPVPDGREPDPELFVKYGKLATDVAAELAQYETPRLRAIIVGGMSPEQTPQQQIAPPTIDLVANENDPGNLFRVWQSTVGGQRRAPRAADGV